MNIRLFFVGLFLLPLTAIADLRGRVVKVPDGDTLDMLSHHQIVRIRLSGIDAPEKRQAFGQRARQNLSRLVATQSVVAVGDKTDRYGRLIATLWLNGRDINAQQVISGLAWAYRYQGKATTPAYVRLEHLARHRKTGLWSDASPVEPWRWRRENR